MRSTMKAQHANGRGSRSPFLTSYALTLAFITFVSVLYFKDFSSTLHRPFLHRPRRHAAPDKSQAGRRAAAERLPFAVGAAPAGCDVGRGEWVYDDAARPWYQEEECPYIQPQLTCQAHGRPDRAYQHWRWQPRGCSLPRYAHGFPHLPFLSLVEVAGGQAAVILIRRAGALDPDQTESS
jgi:hypothetical protein